MSWYYSDLIGSINAVKLEAYDTRLFYLLEDSGAQEAKVARPTLTSLVVHKSGDRQPGSGFYELDKFLGNAVEDQDTFRVGESNKTYDSIRIEDSSVSGSVTRDRDSRHRPKHLLSSIELNTKPDTDAAASQ